MRPTDLIRDHLGQETWNKCRPTLSFTGDLEAVEELSPFQSSKTYIIHGETGQFDFPTLPTGSYCVYVADGRKAIRLTRIGREIESVLKENWNTLPNCDPVVLTRLILKFFDGGIRSTHSVLPDADALYAFEMHYVLDEKEFKKSQELIGTTSVSRCEDMVVIRAATLCGWMHNKRNLGIEHIRISKSGEVHLDERKVLSNRIFKSVPQFRY